jgi:Cytochrome c oxidase subunit VIIc
MRGFHTSRARMSGHGPHYPEGPMHNIPWTPKGKWNIRIKLFSFYGTGYGLLG